VQHAAIEDVMMTLAKSHVTLVQSHKELAEAQKRLAEAQAETGGRLNAFIVFFEKYINRHNGDEPPKR
jgi:hypothetical protein